MKDNVSIAIQVYSEDCSYTAKIDGIYQLICNEDGRDITIAFASLEDMQEVADAMTAAIKVARSMGN